MVALSVSRELPGTSLQEAKALKQFERSTCWVRLLLRVLW